MPPRLLSLKIAHGRYIFEIKLRSFGCCGRDNALFAGVEKDRQYSTQMHFIGCER